MRCRSREIKAAAMRHSQARHRPLACGDISLAK
jgi:hypothetical protein